MAEINKEPKVITEADEVSMRKRAARDVINMALYFPKAREIDLLNAFLVTFTERVEEADRNAVEEAIRGDYPGSDPILDGGGS